MEQKIILITGSTDGIGYQTAIELANLGHKVIIHGRNQEKAKLAMEKVKKETNSNNLSYVYADLSSFSQIKEMVAQLYNTYDHLDVLINNAGIIRDERAITQEGVEETFAINYIAPFLITNLLLDLLKKGNSSRIVNVASRVQSNHLDLDDFPFEKGYTAVKAYARSKSALIMFTYLLAEKLKDTGITVNCLHPGVINTKVLRAAFSGRGAPLTEGAKTLVFAAISSEIENKTGNYFVFNRPERSKDITYDKELQESLWKKTEEILGMEF